MNVSLIGSGNLAWHLGPALDNAGYVVKEVWSRDIRHSHALTERLYQAEAKDTLDFSDSPSSLFIIAVADAAIRDIASEIVLPDEAVLVHTSGSQPLSLLQFAAIPDTGVFFPLQTFKKSGKLDFSNVPIFIETLTERAELSLLTVARAISRQVRKVTEVDRIALHVASVFASGFSNHMILMAKKILETNNLSFDLLKPTITEAMTKSLNAGPEKAQSGPAMESDLETLDRHMAFLESSAKLAELYRVISQQILDQDEPAGQ